VIWDIVPETGCSIDFSGRIGQAERSKGVNIMSYFKIKSLNRSAANRFKGEEVETRSKFRGFMRYADYSDYLKHTKENVQVSIELASVCNFHCYYCQHPKMERKREFITDRMFYHLADQLPECANGGAVGVNWAGESTLHPKFIEYSKYINKMGLKIALPTNGSTLRNELFQIDLAWIQVYLDKSAEDFARRSNLNYEQHLNRIITFTKEWLRNSSTIRLRYWIQKTKAETLENLQSKYDFLKKFVKELGLADEVSLDFSNRVIAEYKKPNGAVLQIGQMPILSGGIFPVSEDNPAADFKHKNRDFGFCDSAWKHTKVTTDGRLTLCCQALEGKTIFSKPDEIWKRSIKDIWLHHEEVERYRSHMIRGELIYEACRQCLDAFPSRELYHPHHIVYEKKAQKYSFGEVVPFDSAGYGDAYAVRGFAPPTSLTWTMFPSATLRMILKNVPIKVHPLLAFKAVGRFAADGSDRDYFEVFINDRRCATLPIIHQKLHEYVVDLNDLVVKDDFVLNIEFIVSNKGKSFLPAIQANMPRIGLQSLVIYDSQIVHCNESVADCDAQVKELTDFNLKIDKWGPQSTDVNIVPNLQHNGNAGIWISLLSGTPQDLGELQVLFNGEPAKKTHVNPDTILAAIEPDNFTQAGDREIAIKQVSTGIVIPVGTFIVKGAK
jgi:organic radical activating enzyme